MSEKPRPGVGVGIMLFKDNKVLLGKRNDDPEKAASALHGEGTWTMPGGKIRFGEKYQEAAYREVLEETGIQLEKDTIKVIKVNNDIAPDTHFVTIGVLCEHFEGEPEAREPEEITEWKWFALNELPSPLYPPSKKILDLFTKS